MLQLGEHDQALHLYQRVLSADPEDAPAHVGIAAIHEERGLLDEAIWYLGRALELAPGDRDVRLRLGALQAERGAEAAEGASLTRAGLTRMWMRGQLYAKAADELSELVVEEPHRYDLRTALVEALWRSRQYDRVAIEAQTLLAELPHCLKANLVLGQVWLGTDRDEEARALLRRAQALDPDNAAAQALFGHRSPLPPRVARLPLHDDGAPSPELSYLLSDDIGSESRDPTDRVSEGHASPLADTPIAATSPEALWEELRSALSWRSTVTSPPTTRVPPARQEDSPAGDASRGDPRSLSAEMAGEPTTDEAPLHGLSLIDVRRRYVEEHPDDHPARLDLARRYRDVGNLAAALEQYGRLVMEDYGTLRAVLDDLDRLNRIYLRTPAIETLLARARLRDSLKPPQHSP
jgi:tetratricopeptide (TPR) repeat protein